MNPKAKTIKMLLYDGTLNGIVQIVDSSWNPGELYAAPRVSVENLLKEEACHRYGIYLLLSSEKVYVGQASDLERRVRQHMAGKDWWERVVLLTTEKDSFNKSDIDYLEHALINKARSFQKLDCDNKKKGNPPKVDRFRTVELNQYLEGALFLLQLIGVRIFEAPVAKKRRRRQPVISVDVLPEVAARPPKQVAPGHSVAVPSLPEGDLKIGRYVFQAMQNLSDAGYMFSDDAIDEMCTPEWSKEHFHTVKPFMRRYVEGITDTRDEKGYPRFYSTPFQFGNAEVYVSHEWYERQRDAFIQWYASL